MCPLKVVSNAYRKANASPTHVHVRKAISSVQNSEY